MSEQELRKKQQIPPCMVMCMINMFSCFHDIYLSCLNCMRMCHPPRPASDLL